LLPLRGIDLNYGFVADSLLKLWQTKSVLENPGLDTRLVYPFRELDPDMRNTPVSPFIYSYKGENYAQYPAGFAILSAPVLSLFGPKGLVPFTILLGFLAAIAASLLLNLNFYSRLYLALGTPVIFYGYEFSENTLFLLFNFIGFGLVINPRYRYTRILAIISSLLIILAMHLRMEGMMFAFLFFLIYYLYQHLEKKDILVIWNLEYYRILSLIIFGLVFLISNYYLYGNIFGSRYLLLSEKANWDLVIKLKQTFVLLFFGLGKMGFFGYMNLFLIFPIIFILKIAFIRPAKDIMDNLMPILFILFIPLLCFLSGTEAFVNWGPRYLSLAILPGIYMMNRSLDTFILERKSKVILSVLIFLSVFITYRGIVIQTNSMKMLKQVHESIYKSKEGVYLFDSNYLAGFSGPAYLNQMVFTIKSENEVEGLADFLNSKAKSKSKIFTKSKLTDETIDSNIRFKPEFLYNFLHWVTTKKFESLDESNSAKENIWIQIKTKYNSELIQSTPFFDQYLLTEK
jgi:hypothetical protein